MLFALLATGYVLLQHKGIQNRLTDYLTAVVSKELNTTFTVGEVDLAFPYRLRLKQIYLEDLHGDTLLYAKSITLGVSKVNPLKKIIKVNAVNLKEAFVRLAVDSSARVNIEFIIDRLKGDGSASGTQWTIALNNIRLKESRFRLLLFPFEDRDKGINFTDLRLDNLHADLHHFTPGKDSTTFRIRSLSGIEANGFQFQDVMADFRLSKHFLKLEDFRIRTPYSSLKGNGVRLLFDSWDDFKDQGIYEKVRLLVDVEKSSLDLFDLGFFSPAFYDTHQVIAITGQTKGTPGNLKVKDLEIRSGQVSYMLGDFSINGLPSTSEAFIHAEFKELRTSVEDIAWFRLPGNKNLQLPGQLNKLGIISYKGKFTGFLKDFVAYGTFNTSLGVISSDLLLKPDTSNYFSFSGKVNARDFNLGSLLDIRETVGNLTMAVTADGYYSMHDLKAELGGVINSLFLKGYQYKNIQLSGTIFNKTYNGALFINDPNINLDFQGRVDLSKETTSYDFSANVTRANLYALNIDKSDPEFNASFYIEANATGNNINDLNGEISLLNSLFVKKDKQLQIYDIQLKSVSQPEQQSLHLNSDFIEARLTGHYDLANAGFFFKKLLHNIMPALVDSGQISTYSTDNSFQLSAVFKNTRPIFDFFLPDYFIDAATTLETGFDAGKQQFNLHCNSPMVRIKNLVWNDYHLNVQGDTSYFAVESGGLSMVINDQIMLDNFTVISQGNHDSIDFTARWNNWEDIVYRGSIKANLLLTRPSGHSQPHIAIHVLPTTVITYDTIWNINQCEIFIDSNNIIINDFSINHNEERFTLNGRLSSDPSDKIDLAFQHFNLGNLNVATNAKGFQIEGVLNGQASFSSLFDNPLVVSNLKIDSLMVNNEKLGTANILSTLNSRKKSIEVQAYALRDKLKTVLVDGNYYLSNKGLDFTIRLDKLRLNPFNPYLDKLIDNLRGIASGELALDGTIEKPVLNGELNLQKAAFTIKYLQSRYNFSEKIRIVNNNIFFRDMRVFDGYGNRALVNGSLRNRYFRDLTFDVGIQADNVLFLNTRSTDNKMFYGTAFATGLVNISGSPSNVEMEISAKTEKNTVFNIPLSNEGELTEYNFITLIKDDKETSEVSVRDEYKVDLSGIRMNFDLEVTPDAEVQIIFDPKVGDILSGSGSGNLNMKISTSGNFIMFGDLTIDKGDYLFTLGNVINKKFTINPGGTIRWNGDPIDATVDLTANYRTRASLVQLFGTEETGYSIAGGEADYQNRSGLGYQNKIAVDCQLIMSGKLLLPTIRYDINLPQTEEETRLRVKNVINTPDELNKQFISLVVLNSFVPSQSRTGSAEGAFASSNYSGVAGANASELLSNQLSHWLSQISNDFDVGINYRPDKRVKGEEVEVMLSTQLFNDRLTINGSVDVATNAYVATSNAIVGEFDIDYKLGKSGRFRLKTYNHINNEILIENSPYTQGLGFFYKEEFNTLKELARRYWRSIAGKKEDKDIIINTGEKSDRR